MTKSIQFLNNHPTQIPTQLRIPRSKSFQSLINLIEAITWFINFSIPFCSVVGFVVEGGFVVGVCGGFLEVDVDEDF